MKNIIEKLKRFRKISSMNNKYSEKYAFVGIGNHSINNLYPVLNYLNIDIKYIVSKSEKTAEAINKKHKDIKGISDFNIALNDPEIKGILISANPSKHFELIKQALEKDKNVFVEKPACLSLKELHNLISIEKSSKGFVLVGLQKRFSPLYQSLKKNIKNTNSYTLNYSTGYYPEGDAVLDLFIHPLDTISYLFGKAEILSCQKIKRTEGAQTILLHLKHPDGIIGSVQLSSDFSWAQAKESIFVNCKDFYIEGKNTELLTSTNKSNSILGIPLEKVREQEISKKILYQQNNFLPAFDQNSLYAAGYFNEITNFLNLCENKCRDNNSSLESLVNTYQLIDRIKN